MDKGRMTGTVLITGAGSGIGRELARVFAAEGMAIAGIDKNPEGLVTLEEELRQHNRPIGSEVADVTDIASMNRAAAQLESRLGPVELLIASAGIAMETTAMHFAAADIAALIQVNLIGVANSIGAVLPGMIERRRGHIAAMSSLASFRGLPRLFGYCATKAGLNALLEGLRVELRSHNIAVTTICPGWIRTPMCDQVKDKVPLMEVNVAARRIAAAIRQRRRFTAFPRSTAWQLRLLRWLPDAASDWLVGRMMARTATTVRPCSQ